MALPTTDIERQRRLGDDQRAASPEQRLAIAIVAGCVDVLKAKVPTTGRARLEWEKRRKFESEFIADPRASAPWVEAAGLDWDAVVSRLRHQNLLHPIAFATAA